ncbi:MAG: M23 family metallopeptidase [Bacteroidales bacterium]|nr:M23 family metallopeptidase [Bacteroidales bacterium]
MNNIEYQSIVGYGNRLHPIYQAPKMHYGIDIRAEKGTSVKSAITGIAETVLYSKSEAGKYIVINSGNGIKVKIYHLDTLMIKEGEQVVKGQLIGLAGRTGLAIEMQKY